VKRNNTVVGVTSEYPGAKCQFYSVGFEICPEDFMHKSLVGIDPGVKTGVAIWGGGVFRLIQVQYPPKREIGRVNRLSLIADTFAFNGGIGGYIPLAATVTVEDAAFGQRYGQVALAENRAAAVLGLRWICNPIIIVNPATARKVVFGNGRQKASELWKDTGLPSDCLEAMALAFFSVYQERFNDL
jgi:hypothetical protein